MPDQDSPRFGLPYLAAAQAQKHVTHNEALRRLDALLHPHVLGLTAGSQPSEPVDGDAWLLLPGKSGADWNEFPDYALAFYADGYWHAVAAAAGMTGYDRSTQSFVHFDGSLWLPLARPPLRANRGEALVAFVGTSLVQHGTSASAAGNCAHSARGWQTWAHVLSFGRFHAPVWWDNEAFPDEAGRRWFRGLNEGVSGQSGAEIIARLHRVVALRPALVVLDIGTNDVGLTGMTFEALRDTTIEAVRKLTGEGIEVLLLPVLARATSVGGLYASGGSARRLARHLNQWRRDWAATEPGVFFLDWNLAWVDPQNADGEPKPGFSNDGTHIGVRGAFALGQAFARWFEARFPPASPLVTSAADAFDSAINPRGNLLPNPLMQRTSGGSLGAGTMLHPSPPAGSVAGVADSWRVERAVGSAITAQVHVAPRMDEWGFPRGHTQVITFAPSGSAIERFYFRTGSADLSHTLPSGTWVQAGIDLSVSAWSGWRSIRLRIEHRNGSTGLQTVYGLDEFDTGSGVLDAFPEAAWSGRVVTPLMQLVEGTAFRCRLEIALDGSVPGSPSLEASGFFLRVVDDPRPALGLVP